MLWTRGLKATTRRRARWSDIVEEFGDLSEAYATMAANIEKHRKSSAPYYAWMASVIRPYLGRRTA